MTINDVNTGANIALPVVQPKATPKKPEVAAPSKGGDVRDSAEAMSKAGDQRKSQSMNEIAGEMAAEIREAVAAINEAVEESSNESDFSADEAFKKRFVWFK